MSTSSRRRSAMARIFQVPSHFEKVPPRRAAQPEKPCSPRGPAARKAPASVQPTGLLKKFKMRLLTHNMLQCPITKSYPLTLETSEVDEVEVDYRREFVLRMLPRLNWDVLRSAAAALNVPGLAESLPAEVPAEDATDEVLRPVHAALMQWHVVEGLLRSGEGPTYVISGGIPNLLPRDTPRGAGEEGAEAAGAAAGD